jgi:hypothetical protein
VPALSTWRSTKNPIYLTLSNARRCAQRRLDQRSIKPYRQISYGDFGFTLLVGFH